VAAPPNSLVIAGIYVPDTDEYLAKRPGPRNIDCAGWSGSREGTCNSQEASAGPFCGWRSEPAGRWLATKRKKTPDDKDDDADMTPDDVLKAGAGSGEPGFPDVTSALAPAIYAVVGDSQRDIRHALGRSNNG